MWLPTFLKTSELHFSNSQAALLTNMVDVGAIVGSLVLGLLSDLMRGRRSIAGLSAICAGSTIAFCIYKYVTEMPVALYYVLMFFLGFCISGLYNLIAAVCAADLGRQPALLGNEKATSTVTGIIDGSGTIGSAIG
jgi:MFS transporter, OPA family, solute carrier family 37 (glycerol-3-phosphate transporter), member 3